MVSSISPIILIKLLNPVPPLYLLNTSDNLPTLFQASFARVAILLNPSARFSITLPLPPVNNSLIPFTISFIVFTITLNTGANPRNNNPNTFDKPSNINLTAFPIVLPTSAIASAVSRLSSNTNIPSAISAKTSRIPEAIPLMKSHKAEIIGLSNALYTPTAALPINLITATIPLKTLATFTIVC